MERRLVRGGAGGAGFRPLVVRRATAFPDEDFVVGTLFLAFPGAADAPEPVRDPPTFLPSFLLIFLPTCLDAGLVWLTFLPVDFFTEGFFFVTFDAATAFLARVFTDFEGAFVRVELPAAAGFDCELARAFAEGFFELFLTTRLLVAMGFKRYQLSEEGLLIVESVAQSQMGGLPTHRGGPPANAIESV